MAELEAYFASAGSGLIVSNAIWSQVVVVVLLVVRHLLGRLLDRRISDATTRYRGHKVLRLATWAVIAVIVAAIWLDGVAGLATVVAIIAAGLAIALRDPIVDLGGWLYISARHPFKIGDRIAIGYWLPISDIGHRALITIDCSLRQETRCNQP